MKAQNVLFLGLGLVLAGRIISKLNTVGALSYKLTQFKIKKVPLYQYLRAIPVEMVFKVDNYTDEKLPFRGFDGTASMEGISPVPFQVKGSGEIPAQSSTEIPVSVNLTSSALVDAIIKALSGQIPKIVNVKGNLYLGQNPLKVDTDVNILEYV